MVVFSGSLKGYYSIQFKDNDMNKLQNKINETQKKYDELCELLPELEADLVRFQRAVMLIRELENFAADDFLHIYEVMEDREEFDLKTNGNLSVMNEDAVWNAFCDFQRIAWARIREATAALDPNEQE